MNESCPFRYQQPSNNLPHWATITQVSTFLSVPRNAVRSAVRRAVRNRADWVKKETSGDNNMSVFLINTRHDAYRSLAERWKQHVAFQSASGECTIPGRDDCFSSKSLDQSSSPALTSLSQNASVQQMSQAQTFLGLDYWPTFRSWLYLQGLQIFTNILADEGHMKPWQWRWDDLHGEGYESEEAAIIAAFQARFDENQQKREEESRLASSLCISDSQYKTSSSRMFWSRILWSKERRRRFYH